MSITQTWANYAVEISNKPSILSQFIKPIKMNWINRWLNKLFNYPKQRYELPENKGNIIKFKR
ncbi:MAG: hypothetical protein ACFFG0_37335 [Candidatus Thorarchaeota archaeon]